MPDEPVRIFPRLPRPLQRRRERLERRRSPRRNPQPSAAPSTEIAELDKLQPAEEMVLNYARAEARINDLSLDEVLGSSAVGNYAKRLGVDIGRLRN